MSERYKLSFLLMIIVFGIAYFTFSKNIPWDMPWFSYLAIPFLLMAIVFIIGKLILSSPKPEEVAVKKYEILGSYQFDVLYSMMTNYLNVEDELHSLRVSAERDHSAYGPRYQLRYRQEWQDSELKRIVTKYQDLMSKSREEA